jgi:FKBP-type peptidyl-prolyl cis-trans isomerase
MKKIITRGIVSLVLLQLSALSSAETVKAGQSYAAGVSAARLYLTPEVDIDLDAFIKGLKDAYGKKTLQYSEKQLNELISQMQFESKKKVTQQRTLKEADGRQVEPVFMKLNAERYGVLTADMGYQYKVIKQKKEPGESPAGDDIVTIKFKTTTARGALIASTQGSMPWNVKLSSLTGPLQDAIKMMSVGSVWEFYLPENLAVSNDLTDSTPPQGRILVYSIELLNIQHPSEIKEVQ